MRNLAAGVTIVTTTLDGEHYGMTATSFNSVSLDPMLVQVSLDLKSRTYKAVKGSGLYAVNILAEDQVAVARRFAIKSDDRFEGLPVELGETGVPLLSGAIGTLECRVTEELPGGDHAIFVGEVVAGAAGSRPPLLYFRGMYYRLNPKEETDD